MFFLAHPEVALALLATGIPAAMIIRWITKRP